MFNLFGTASAGGSGFLANPLFSVLVVFLSIYIFFKFCTWAKSFYLSAGIKKIIYLLTAVSMAVFNVMYSRGNAMVIETGDWGMATTALMAALIWVFIFAFALMAQTKTE